MRPCLKENLINRAYVHQLRMLFRTPQISPYMKTLEKTFEKLQSCLPEKISGKNIFLREAMSAMTETVGRSHPSQDDVRQVIRRHGSIYSALPLEVIHA